MRKPAAILGSAIFFVVVPCVLAGLVPWWINHWKVGDAFLGMRVLRVAGVILIVAGLPGLLDSFRRFAVEGLGTPAPIAPTQNLVIGGLYRYVRNPMYLSVLAIIWGQALLFGDWRLLAYGAVFFVVCHIFVVAYEEPVLYRTYGDEYIAYQEGVPRWLPRFSAWRSS